jgi:chromosomal replication initiation ATPase DnaA
MKAIRAQFPKDSLAEIGRLFNRDHTTVIHALRSVAE